MGDHSTKENCNSNDLTDIIFGPPLKDVRILSFLLFKYFFLFLFWFYLDMYMYFVFIC